MAYRDQVIDMNNIKVQIEFTRHEYHQINLNADETKSSDESIWKI